jgi:hypothetical protein
MLLSKFSKSLMGLLIGFGLMGCGGSGSSAPAGPGAGGPDQDAPRTVSESVTLKSGSGYECFLRSSQLRCRGSVYTMPEISSSFTTVASGVVSFEVFAQSLCFEILAETRPVSTERGSATYCAGLASFDTGTFAYLFDYMGSGVIRYGGGFSQVTHGAVNLNTTLSLLSGADVTLAQFLAYSAGPGNSLHIVTDSAGSSVTSVCVLSLGMLTCPTFAAQVE